MRCYQCMKEYEAETEVCPHCGFLNSMQNKTAYRMAPGTRLRGRYYIGVVLGTGGFGIIYKAYDEKLDRVVAIKEYYPDGMVKRSREKGLGAKNEEPESLRSGHDLGSFAEEAGILLQLKGNPNIVQMYHCFLENHTGYIVMEYLEGVSLRYFLEVNEEHISVPYAKEIALSIGQALSAMHRKKILHRDVSPDNIFLCTDGRIKLIDFGAACCYERQKEKKHEIVIKPGYAPIEQYRVNGREGPYTDIYALGATFYRAVTGVVPPDATKRCCEDQMLSPGVYNRQVPAYLDAAIGKAMNVEAKGRFHSVDAFLYVLKHPKRAKAVYRFKQYGRRAAGIAALGLILWCGCRQRSSFFA